MDDSDSPNNELYRYGPPFYLASQKKVPFAEIYLTSFVSACTAEIVGYPFDVCKTRLHIQGEIASKSAMPVKYRGMVATAIGIIREEGIHKLYGGISAMVLRHSIFTGLKMYLYDTLRNKLTVIDKDGKASLPFLRGALCGMLAGAGANMISSPTDLIKVQMQMEGKRRLMGEPPRIHNIFQALTSIYRAGGVPALWKGTVPNCTRAALVTMGDVSCYDQSKRRLMVLFDSPDNRLIQFMAAMIAGFTGAVLSTPADVVKSRIMNQPTDEKGRGLHYKGMIDCFTKLVREEGVVAMYKGFLPFWLRVGPWAMVFWTTFEQIRRFRGDEGY
ncbi:LOW QUALITY PROTEIN: mitochondrial uncoupling protein 4-like [Drosophila sulfurigaster albostrigata]|uniref:LOW QUALITY PROTEIN: mitochondrial uncoupling protein 4-like n=1 Tax=Drosophila sulfurigaster albostrigata TaxID=89887 RepID=UPI002D218ABC|nr:LOW QUALITY PROTEIN: mitochondrial uncoupling protein 4-like [Drosophila sulfurigaster albostrigata]